MTGQLTLYEMPWVSDMATKLDSALTQSISERQQPGLAVAVVSAVMSAVCARVGERP